tara:strand:- start:76 stop:201 length:126 start_codon:yes stop_codon:yes gene_type:complete
MIQPKERFRFPMRHIFMTVDFPSWHEKRLKNTFYFFQEMAR